MPVPAAGQALVEVEATGISFAEQEMRRGRYPGQPKFPFVPGYDLVGIVPRSAPASTRHWSARVAAVTKTGGWARHALVDAARPGPGARRVDPAEAETLVVNGITAWQMLHRKARVRRGRRSWCTAPTAGSGTTLVQLARHAGVRVIGTAAPRHHDALRATGRRAVDYDDPAWPTGSASSRPAAWTPSSTTSAARASTARSTCSPRGGTLVAYGTAAKRNDTNNLVLSFTALYPALGLWSLLPNGRRAHFYNFWGRASS